MDILETTKHNHKHMNNENLHDENSAQKFTICVFFSVDDVLNQIEYLFFQRTGCMLASGDTTTAHDAICIFLDQNVKKNILKKDVHAFSSLVIQLC